MKRRSSFDGALVDDREALVAELRRRGVDYLMPAGATATEPMDSAILLASLASHRDPRLRQAIIALLLLQPQLSSQVIELGDRLRQPAERVLRTAYMAAVYLQRMWRIRLRRYLGESPELPDLFSRELGLPDPLQGHGKPGLHALAEWQSERSGEACNHLAEYESVADLLFSSLQLRRRRA